MDHIHGMAGGSGFGNVHTAASSRAATSGKKRRRKTRRRTGIREMRTSAAAFRGMA
jgi:hypothetical protein